MACPRCGCLMVSRAGDGSGRGGPSLVCTRCNHPIPAGADAAGGRNRLGEVATLLALVIAGGVLFVLSELHDMRSPPPQRGGGQEERAQD